MSRETKILLGIVVAIVIGLVGVFMIFNKPGTTASTDTSKLVRADSPKTGSGSVQLVEFGDYQCPACGQAQPSVDKIMKEYAGKVQLVWRNFPLTSIHKNAMSAASYAQAAGKQGKFWEMHNMLYAKQSEWSESGDPTTFYVAYAKDLGLNVDKLKSDAASASVADFIKRDMDDGNALAIQGTPTFYVNNVAVANIDYASLKAAIDSALAK